MAAETETTTIDETQTVASSATETHETVSTSDTSTKEETLAEGLEKIAKQVVKDAPSAPEEDETPPTEEDDESSEAKPEPESKGEKEPPKTEQKEKKETEKEGEKKEPVPYDRFQEVVQQKNTFEEQIKTLTPLAQAQQAVIAYCQKEGITPKEFGDTLELLALMKKDPKAAKARLQPTLDQLDIFTGDKLPPELQKAVDDGEVTLTYAKRLAAAESGSKFGERRLALTQEQISSQNIQRFISDLTATATSWIDQKKSVDPDFQPKKNGEADGKFELFYNKLNLSISPQTVHNVADLQKLLEQAYADAEATIHRFVPPKRNGAPTVRVRRSTTANESEPKSLGDVVSAVARKHGIEYTAPRN